jgi:hypothetical protein
MIGKYSRGVLMIVMIIFSFCSIVSPAFAEAKTDPRIPRNKIVALVYDDSGSMWEQKNPDGSKNPIDNWKYANYALQSFVALMDTQDQLKVVYMSSPELAEPVELNENLRQLAIDRIRAWNKQSGTPITSLHTAMKELNQLAESYDHSDFWLIVLTDGVFTELTPGPGKYSTKEHIEKTKSTLFKSLEELKGTVEKKGATMHTTLIPTETYLNPEEQLIMADFKRQWKESSDGLVLESNGQLEIIQRINEVAALMTNRDPSEEKLFDLNPTLEGNQLILESPFPLRRISIIEQSPEEKASFNMKEFYVNNKRIEQGMEGPYKIKTPDDPHQINPPIRGTLTHLKNVNGDAIIESGTYKIVFDQPLTEDQKKNIQVLAEPAVDFKIDIQKMTEDGSLTDDASVFFEGSKMRVATTLIKSESTNDEIDIRNIDVDRLFEVEAQIGDAKVPLTYDSKQNKFIGDFTLTQKGETPVKVKVNIKGFYQKEKETSLNSLEIRKMELVADTDSWSATLNELDAAKPLKITPMMNGKEISEAELKQIFPHLSIQTPENLKVERKQEGNQILLYPKGLTPLFRTAVGEIPLKVTLPGSHPKEMAEDTFKINIKDISPFEKYGPIIGFSLLGLLVLLYVYGIWRKPRFDSQRISIEYKRSRRKGRVQDVRGETLDFHTNWFSKWLIPYIPEKKSIYDLTFKAHASKDRVLLTKECQESNFVVKFERLADRSNKEDVPIFNNNEIRIERGNYDMIYIFKAQ